MTGRITTTARGASRRNAECTDAMESRIRAPRPGSRHRSAHRPPVLPPSAARARPAEIPTIRVESPLEHEGFGKEGAKAARRLGRLLRNLGSKRAHLIRGDSGKRSNGALPRAPAGRCLPGGTAATVAALLLLALPVPTVAQPNSPPRLALPIDCVPGRDCHVQNYVDADPGPGSQDFACGPLSYDTHKGTDFALPHLAAMDRGVTVRAAAPGTVTGRRDGMADRLWTPDQDLAGRDCGNGVVIDHGGGWETQYCHMARGSVRVQQGQQVDTGTPLGEVGLSGRSQFPHLHLALRRDGAPVDPFAPDNALPCGTPQEALWANPLDYAPGGILDAGFLDALPDYDAVKAGTAGRAALPADSPALVLWASLFGARAGDSLTLTITAPDGPFTTQVLPLERTQAQLYRASGKRVEGLTPGLYTGRITLTRQGETLAQQTTQVQVTP